jgi:hypothetical protein
VRSATEAGCRRSRDDGVGLIPLAWGVLASFMFLFLAVQMAVSMYTTSTLTALGQDATRRAATGGGTPAAVAEADDWFRNHVGDSVTLVDVVWTRTGDTISLSLEAHPPNLMINRVTPLSQSSIQRTFVVRVEHPVSLATMP